MHRSRRFGHAALLTSGLVLGLSGSATIMESALLNNRVFCGCVTLADKLRMLEFAAFGAVERLFRRAGLFVDFSRAHELPLCLVVLPSCSLVSFTLVLLTRSFLWSAI